MTVAIDINAAKTGSVTIVDLPIGKYAVEEKTDWSWRFTQTGKTATASSGSNSTQSALTTDGYVEVFGSMTTTATFTNELTNHDWLSGNAYAKNVFNVPPAASTKGALLPGEDEKKKKAEA